MAWWSAGATLRVLGAAFTLIAALLLVVSLERRPTQIRVEVQHVELDGGHRVQDVLDEGRGEEAAAVIRSHRLAQLVHLSQRG